MIITDVWSIHYENFLIQVEGTEEEIKVFHEALVHIFPTKTFLISIKGGKYFYGSNGKTN